MTMINYFLSITKLWYILSNKVMTKIHKMYHQFFFTLKTSALTLGVTTGPNSARTIGVKSGLADFGITL